MNQRNRNPLVSVIIPVFNVVNYLREALDSVINQSYQNLEIVVIDDGSYDGSELICDEYKERDSRIILVHQTNGGLSEARNTGLDIITGEVVAFLDSDDAFHADMIQEMVSVMQRFQTDIVICGVTNYCTTGRMNITLPYKRIGYERAMIYSSKEALEALIKGEIAQVVWNKIYSRELWETVRFPNGHIYEDVYVTYKLLELANRISIIPAYYVLNRTREGSITHINTAANTRDWILAKKQYIHYVEAQTPGLFEISLLNKVKRDAFIGLFVMWSELPATERLDSEDIRTVLVELGGDVIVTTKSLKNYIAYRMVRYCPGIVPTIWKTYKKIGLGKSVVL